MKLAKVVVAVAITGLAFSAVANAQGRDNAASAKEYLSVREPQLAQATQPVKKLMALLNLAPAALAAGETEKARLYSAELMAVGESLKSQPGFGPGMKSDAIHIGNLVLGEVSLKDGDVVKAKWHLLAAGHVEGSPVLKSFGPGMLLARDLLTKGERAVVVEYLDACASFWDMQDGKLGRWKAIIMEGGVPDFGVHLMRGLSTWTVDKRPSW